ncbi:BTB/POZ domain-containing protein KCTD8-like [Ciona intestinalis]
MSESNPNSVIKLSVGGHHYTTTLKTLTSKCSGSSLAMAANSFQQNDLKLDTEGYVRDEDDRLFVDRDGENFRYILDYLRGNADLSLHKLIPDAAVRYRLRLDAEFYGLEDLVKELGKLEITIYRTESSDDAVPEFLKSDSVSPNRVIKRLGSKRWPPPSAASAPSLTIGGNGTDLCYERQNSLKTELWEKGPFFITIGYRGSYTSTSDGRSTDISKFRRITRITVSGRSDVAKEVFQQELNDSRDPERHPSEGYTCRYYLTHNYLELAFEKLASRGFKLVTSSSSGTKSLPSLSKEFKQWTTYNEYLFYRGLSEEDGPLD